MPEISDSVGEGATNKTHDVALVQAMLRVVKDAKNQPYLAGAYDGVYGNQTKTAITRFQTDHKLVPPGAGAKDKNAFIASGGPTVQKLGTLLPAAYKEVRVLANTKTVYLPGADAAANASRDSINNDAKLEAGFRAKAADMVKQFYQAHKLVLYAGPLGRLRTFQQQADLKPGTTKAGPGESNHNFGRAVDLIFKDFEWVTGAGAVQKDTPWLEKLSSTSAAKATAFWDVRDTFVYKLGLFTLKVAWDRPHVQSFDQATVSMRRSLAALLNAVGKTKWGSAPGGYRSDLGLGGPLAAVGTAKQIWAGNATVTKADVVKGLNASKLPLDVARALWAGKPVVKKVAPKAVGPADITAGDIGAVQKFLQGDFKLANQNYLKWKPVP